MPLINNRNLLPGKEFWFLENVRDIPNFPVLWIDLGADVESVRGQKCLVKMTNITKCAGPEPRGEADF